MARCSAMAMALLVLAGPFLQAGRAQAPAPAPSTGGALAVTSSAEGDPLKATCDIEASTPCTLTLVGAFTQAVKSRLQL